MDWNNIVRLATRILKSNGGLPKPTDVHGHSYDKIIYRNGIFLYYETSTAPSYSSYIKVITKQDIIGIIWSELTVEERTQFTAEILGSND